MLKRVVLSTLVVLGTVGPLTTIAQSQDGEKQAIQNVIESFGSAINGADLPMLMGHIAEDAVIDSRIARRKVSKQEYADAMARAFERRAIVRFEIRHIQITMIGPSRATVLAAIYPLARGTASVMTMSGSSRSATGSGSSSRRPIERNRGSR
jgi:hypothetical protein